MMPQRSMRMRLGSFLLAIREYPTAVSLLVIAVLMGLSLTVPQRTASRHVLAAEVEPPRLMHGRAGRQISFRDRLVTGLQARLDSEIEFVDAVVEEVHDGHIPRRLVDQTFFWSRHAAARRSRYGRHRRPIIYFRPAMAMRAKRLGVEL